MAHAKVVSGSRLAVGIGCRAGASADDIVALVQRTLADARLNSGNAGLFSIDTKRHEIGLMQAAQRLAMPIRYLSREQLTIRAADAPTWSDRVDAIYDLPSIAETAALVGAGEGSRLLVPRVSAGAVTCAVAVAAG